MSKIVTYDLDRPGQNYPKLITAIQAYDNVKVTESCFIISTDQSCVDIRTYLKTFMDNNDRLFVGELTGNFASYRSIGNGEDLKRVVAN